MVAISLYKGNLHKVPDHPRRWAMPTRSISLKDFRTLLRRRSRALSRLVSVDAAAAAASDYPNSNNPNSAPDDNNCNFDVESEIPLLKEEAVEEGEAAHASVHEDDDEVGGGDERRSEGRDCIGKLVADVADSVAVEVKQEVDDHNIRMESELNDIVENQQVEMEDEGKETEVPVNIAIETSNKEDAQTNKDKRKREVQEKLRILNEKKHSLVQVLKQILNAEEELKRRSSMQGMAVRSSGLLHVDIPNDTGSMTRLNTPRIGSDGILIGEMEGGEPDGTFNHNVDTRHLLRVSNASPSSDSQHRRPAYNVIPHTARTSVGVIGSPLRFLPTGQQGHPSNLPTISVSGTNYIASSPSPAASGGTSAFRDSRIPSPWN